jgi:hypothetical protein
MGKEMHIKSYLAFARRNLALLGICTLFVLAGSPAFADDLRALCPDRPGKGTSPCTLDEGHFQLEVDAFDATYDRSGGVSTDVYALVAPTLKYGLTGTLDVEAGFSPYLSQHTKDGLSDTTERGHGDLFLRTKWNFLDSDGPLTAVVEPFVKIATATRGLGDGALEEGVVLPLAYDLGQGWSLSSTPELDLMLNASGSGRHATAINVVGLGKALDDGVALGAEIWTSQDFDPLTVTSQYSFDLDAAWQPAGFSNFQIDGGVNFGLNRNTPDCQIYMGVSQRI